MDKQLALLHIRTVEAALQVITRAVENDQREAALQALTDIEHNLAALRQLLEERQANSNLQA